MGLEGSNITVFVSANLVPLLNTENATIGTTLDTTAINSIPLNGRNFASLAEFVPGAVVTQLTGSAALERAGNSAEASQNGNRQEQNNFLLDGVDINETLNNGVGYNPSPDAMSEVRVISSNAQAEYGNVNGGDIVALLKSGTNSLHGSAFAYMDNYNLDANTWANKHQSPFTAKDSYTQTIFGGTIGGRILKDKLFYFADYEGIRYHLAGPALYSVATALMRTGDFSELLNPALNSKPIQLYDSQNGFAPYVNIQQF